VLTRDARALAKSQKPAAPTLAVVITNPAVTCAGNCDSAGVGGNEPEVFVPEVFVSEVFVPEVFVPEVFVPEVFVSELFVPAVVLAGMAT